MKGRGGNDVLAALLLSSVFAVPTSAMAGTRVYVQVGPPAPLVETAPVAPVRGYVWVPGYYRWDGRAYLWAPGRYVVPPRPHAAWVPGRWHHHHQGWYWTNGRWR
jgi:hypothetical protein